MTTADHRAVLVDKDLPELLRTLTPFRTEARTGQNGERYEDGLLAGYTEPRKVFEAREGMSALETGILIDDWYARFVADYTKQVIDYVIYSYDTIIAWHCKEHSQAVVSNGINRSRWEKVDAHWTVTDTVITATTAKHQMRVLLALR